MLPSERAWCAIFLALAVLIAVPRPGWTGEVAKVRIAYLSQVVELPPKLSNLELPPEGEGLQGGELAIKDNNTTGSFMKQAFELHSVSVPVDGDVTAAFRQLLAEGYQFILLNVSAARLVELADLPEAGRPAPRPGRGRSSLRSRCSRAGSRRPICARPPSCDRR